MAGIGTTPGKRIKGIRQEPPKSSTDAQLPQTMALPQTLMYMVLWVVEAINPLECTRTLAVPPSQATQIMDDRAARRPSCWLHRLPIHLQILPHLCSSTRYLVWKEGAPRFGLVPPRSRATSTKVTHLSLPIPTSRRL